MAIRSEVTLDTTKARGEARRASNEIAKSMSAAASGGGTGAGGFFKGAESAATKAAAGINLVKTAWATLKGIGELAKDSLDLGKVLDDLRGGLKQALPPAADLETEMGRLESMMDRPGVDWKTATRLHTTLIAMGKDAQLSEDIITGVGNALKSTGDDTPESLAGVVEMLTKIDDKGQPAIKQLSALAASSSAFRVAMEKAFGTTNAADIEAKGLSSQKFLEGLNAGLKSLDRASLDGIDLAIKKLDKANLEASKASSKALALLPDQKSAAGDPAAAAEFRKQLEEANAERIFGLMEAKDLENDLAQAKLKEKDLQDQIDSALPTQRAALRDQLDLAEKKTDAISFELEMQKDLEKLMKEQNLTQDQGLQIIEKKIKNARELDAAEKANAAASKARENAKTQSADTTQRAIDKARSTGNTRRADKLQRASDLATATTEGLNMGLDPAAAAARAKDLQQTKEDQAYRDRTGRSRIHGGGPSRGMSGIDDSLRDIHRTPLGLQGRMSDAAFPSLDKMAAAQANRDKSRDPISKQIAPNAEPQKADPALLQKLDSIDALLRSAVGKDAAKPLSAA